MSYADKLRVPYAVIIGEDEASAGVLSVKNMRTGQQVKLAPAEAAAFIKAGAAEMDSGSIIIEK